MSVILTCVLHQISRIVSAETMEWRFLLLPRHLSSVAPSSAAVVAGEISVLLSARNFLASVNCAEQFISSEAVTSSGVLELYRAVAAAAPSGKARYLVDAASALLEASARADLPDGALRLLEFLIDTPAARLPMGSSCGHLMVKLLSLGRRADARHVFEILADAGERRRKKAMNELWAAGRGADAFKVFGEMADVPVVSYRKRYDFMMYGYLKNGDLQSASEIRTRMMQGGIKLSTQQRRMLRMLAEARACPENMLRIKVEICIMAQDIDEAIRLLRHMSHGDKSPPNAHSYNLVIAGLWKAGRGDEAVKLFGEMTDISLAPNHFTYTVMINGHLKRLGNGLTPRKNGNGDLEAALQLKAQMEQAGFKSDEPTYHLLMAELCSAERLGDVTALFDEMMTQETTLHKIVHSSMLQFLCRINEGQLLRIIEESAKNGVSAADNGCITLLLKELCRIDKVSSAEKALQTFAKTGLVPTTEMYNILIDGYSKIRELQAAFLLYRQMKSHDQLVPNEATHEALLLAVRNNTSIVYWEDVEELFEKNGVGIDAMNAFSDIYGFK